MYNAANNASSQLATSIGAEDTSLAVLDGSSFPEPPFVVSIDDEIIEVGGKSGNTFSGLVRGLEGTAPTAHASGSRVENRFTAGTYQQIVDKINNLVEMGSNANGEYVRWENGLQVCFARRTASQINAVVIESSWTFPAAFIDTNYAVVFGLGGRPTIAGNPDPFTKTLWLHALDRTASHCVLRLLVNDRSAVSGDGATFDAVAVGRWK